MSKERSSVSGGACLLKFVLGIALVMPIHLAGQITGSGGIQGVISDSSGAVIPRAVVEAANLGTGIVTTRITTEAGLYVISPLPAGEYRVTVSAAGFQKLVQEHVMVDALSVVGLNAKLEIGATSETVTVSGSPAR